MNVGVRENGTAKYSQDRELHSHPHRTACAKIYNKSVFENSKSENNFSSRTEFSISKLLRLC